MAKKKHWTQTPAGKRRQRAAARAGWRTRRVATATDAPTTTGSGDTHDAPLPDTTVAFAFGYTQGWLHSYAEGHGVARDALADRVAELLLGAARRTVRGTRGRVSGVRSATPA